MPVYGVMQANHLEVTVMFLKHIPLLIGKREIEGYQVADSELNYLGRWRVQGSPGDPGVRDEGQLPPDPGGYNIILPSWLLFLNTTF